jgi:hypothetical protein
MVVRSTGLVLVACAILCARAAADDEPPYEAPDFMNEPPTLPAGVDASAVWRLDRRFLGGRTCITSQRR